MNTTNEARMTYARMALLKASTDERSAWGRGVAMYALDLLDTVEEWSEYNNGAEIPNNRAELKKIALNGAKDWEQYSWGGSSLCYDGQIAERLCAPSELKRTRNGERNPNGRESWLDCQARALYQAFYKLVQALEA